MTGTGGLAGRDITVNTADIIGSSTAIKAESSSTAEFGSVREVILHDPRGEKDAAVNFGTAQTLSLPAGALVEGKYPMTLILRYKLLHPPARP